MNFSHLFYHFDQNHFLINSIPSSRKVTETTFRPLGIVTEFHKHPSLLNAFVTTSTMFVPCWRFDAFPMANSFLSRPPPSYGKSQLSLFTHFWLNLSFEMALSRLMSSIGLWILRLRSPGSYVGSLKPGPLS